MTKVKNEIATAIWGTLQSVNESDSNMEAANVVDALCKCGRGLHRIADALEALAQTEKGAEILSAVKGKFNGGGKPEVNG